MTSLKSVVFTSLFLIALASLLTASANDPIPAVSRLTALGILEQVRREIIPAEGSPTSYGVAFNLAGYATLSEWGRSYVVASAWAGDFEALDFTLPCCAFTQASADESRNCACGHHVALYGLAKRLLNTGSPRADTQAEIRRWVAYMYPKETLAAEMERRALTDPAIHDALQELKEKGIC